MTPKKQSDKKRALILAGGGIKVAFQAGVLQVWLDEAGLQFDHVDAASGGVFNLAMMCQGMNGAQIANNWRNLNPKVGIDLNAIELIKLFYAESLFTLDNYRRYIFTDWGLNWEKIRATSLEATFNVFNFSKKELEALEAKQMTEDYLVACVSLPMWFPPVHIKEDIYIDSVFLSDANLEEAIRRGADELWVIWTVSEKNEWHPGFVATYFQIIETSADGHYKRIRRRIRENNEAIARGKHGEFGRHIEVIELKADVALHYLIDFSQDRLTEIVNLGVKRAREWCQERNIPLNISDTTDYELPPHDVIQLTFSEGMKGYLAFGETDYEQGYNHGKRDNNYLEFHLNMTVKDVDRFVTTPDHEATTEGWVQCESLGGKLQAKGLFNLFTDEEDPAVKRMAYRLFFSDLSNRPLTLSGHKVIRDDPGLDLWPDTTTLFTRILKGHVTSDAEAKLEKNPMQLAEILIASGILHIYFLDFLKLLSTIRVEGGSFSDRNSARLRFTRFFLGKLWDVYERRILTSGPF